MIQLSRNPHVTWHVDLCTCPPSRNGIDCPDHVLNNPAVRPYMLAHPIFIQVAWDLDLNWAAEPMDRLFWQHDRIEGWPM